MGVYLEKPYETPAKFTGQYAGKKVIIISGGHSVSEILPFKEQIKKVFDCIIVVNTTFKYFDDVADFHLMVEKVSPTAFNRMYLELNAGQYRTDMPRLFNWKGIERYEKRYNVHKLVRCDYDGVPNVRSYTHNGREGLFVGPPSTRRMALGTVLLPAMHFAGILGAAEIYLIGTELLFKGEHDHFYNDKVYRDKTGQDHVKPANRVKIVDVMFKGKKYQTTDYFYESAACLDTMITTIFKDIKVYDFSDGLITKAEPVRVNDFFNGVA